MRDCKSTRPLRLDSKYRHVEGDAMPILFASAASHDKSTNTEQNQLVNSNAVDKIHKATTSRIQQLSNHPQPETYPLTLKTAPIRKNSHHPPNARRCQMAPSRRLCGEAVRQIASLHSVLSVLTPLRPTQIDFMLQNQHPVKSLVCSFNHRSCI